MIIIIDGKKFNTTTSQKLACKTDEHDFGGWQEGVAGNGILPSNITRWKYFLYNTNKGKYFGFRLKNGELIASSKFSRAEALAFFHEADERYVTEKEAFGEIEEE